MVTSSAVVGSSAMSSCGSHDSAIAIITRWRIPPDSWWGYSSTLRAGSEMPTSPRSRHGLRPGSLLVEPAVEAQRLRDLIPDCIDGVQRAHRLLEDHRNVVSPERPHAALAGPDELLPAEPDRASFHDARRRLGEESEDRQRGDRLATSGLADDADRLARTDLEGNAVDGLRHPLVGEEVRAEVAHREERLGQRPRLTSATSDRASPAARPRRG